MSIEQLKPIMLFFLRSILAGLAAAFVLLYLFPGIFTNAMPQKKDAVGMQSTGTGRGDVVSYSKAVKITAPSVVNIYASKVLKRRAYPLLQDPLLRRFFGIPDQEQQRNVKLGSGVILSPDGYLVTNDHVISNADDIMVTLIDGRQAKARVIGVDRETDLALLQIKLDGLPSIRVGDSDDLKVGDVVLAIGNPYDFGQTVTQGIVSAKGRKRLGISTIEDFIQTDADINPGNSGGALINARGQLVGINTAIISSSGGSQGIGLAIPIKLVFDVIRQLLDHGHVIRGYLGVMAEVLPKGTLDSSGHQQAGILVYGVDNGGPAAKAGLIPGDIITEINKTPIYDPQQAFQLISKLKPGTKVEIDIVRGWEDMMLNATVTDKPTVTIR